MILRPVAAGVLWALVATGCRSTGEASAPVPADFELTVATGSLVPGEEDHSILVRADGDARYRRYRASMPGAPALDERSFRVPPGALDTLWRAIESMDFFGLPAELGAPDVRDGGYAYFTVRAGGRTHSVQLRNVRHEPLQALLAEVRRLAPPGADLPYAPP